MLKDVGSFSPRHTILLYRERLGACTGSLWKNTGHLIALKKKALYGTMARLDSLSPLSILSRGYSITSKLPGRSVVKTAADVQQGDKVDIRLHEGNIICVVEGTSPE